MKKWYITEAEYDGRNLCLILQKLTDQGILSEDIKTIYSSKSFGIHYHKVLYLSEKEISL